MQVEDADDGVGGKPHGEGGLPQKLEPGHRNYGTATKVCHRPQEPDGEQVIQIHIQIQKSKQNKIEQKTYFQGICHFSCFWVLSVYICIQGILSFLLFPVTFGKGWKVRMLEG